MYQFNSKTQINRTFKMRELSKLFKVDSKMKEEAQQIDYIALEQVLSPQTLHLEGAGGCEEIYIFAIHLKEKETPWLWVKALDQVTTPHTYFRMYYQGEVKEIGIYREKVDEEIKHYKTYENEWHLVAFNQLPYCKDLLEVYSCLLEGLIPLKRAEEESLKALLGRYEEIQILEKQIKSLEQKIQREKQSKKKLELARALRALQGEYREKRGE